MQIQYYPYAFFLFVSSFITLVASWIAWKRTAPGSHALAALLLALTIWSASDATQFLQTTLVAKLFWLKVLILGVAFAPPFFVLFTVKITQNEHWLRTRNLVCLFIIPVITIILSWTDKYHHLIFSSTRIVEKNGFILIELVRGYWYIFNAAFSYLAIVAGLLALVHGSLRASPLFRNQYRILLLGCIIPFSFSLYSQIRFASVNQFDLAPITFGVSGVAFLVAVLRTRFMDLIPVARGRLIENMGDGVLVLDAQHRIVDFNSAMESLLADKPASLLGKSAFEIFSDWVDKSNDIFGDLDTQTEIRIPSAPSRFLDLRVTPLFDSRQQLTGRLMVFRDVTDRKDVEKKLRNANFRLQSQLIEIGILQSQLREQAIRDPLTNLFNRRYLEETLDRELARAARESYPVCIIMLDIDHFKQVNDTYGHEAGDVVLKALADVLMHHSRRGDFCCRYGGEEFVVVMPNIILSVAQHRAESLRDSLNSLRVPYGNHTLSSTFSMGIASSPANGNSRDAILRAADKAMYAAKDAGRDHIRSYDEIEAARR